jgi:hypothetical protein
MTAAPGHRQAAEAVAGRAARQPAQGVGPMAELVTRRPRCSPAEDAPSARAASLVSSAAHLQAPGLLHLRVLDPPGIPPGNPPGIPPAPYGGPNPSLLGCIVAGQVP